ncbi:hypothetical protein DFA_11112 [Cavenderia fasciculata]|uniref:Mitochondrial import inner membrane translocase subunit Tim21 n=1 Tax=Cavenderia fasciculata TaxID=261658 RepID=F4QEZ2_CACFS|nr:uncharacterized protein DFA_11112 [Cavenderia fasciculata]EGG13351.1 hypothetical protein DFA_11112 [Cavenderia fasciculata]|eukprot:XP_004350055.1 hypothetical protein DFA_11112 [Cavenderia fasciculata]
MNSIITRNILNAAKQSITITSQSSSPSLRCVASRDSFRPIFVTLSNDNNYNINKYNNNNNNNINSIIKDININTKYNQQQQQQQHKHLFKSNITLQSLSSSTSFINGNNGTIQIYRYSSSSSKRTISSRAGSAIHSLYFVIVFCAIIGAAIYIFDDMIFEQWLYSEAIDQLHSSQEIVDIFGSDMKAKAFHRFFEKDMSMTEIAKRKNQRQGGDPSNPPPKIVIIKFKLQGHKGVGHVFCKANRLSLFNPEITFLRVNYGTMRKITLIDKDRKKIEEPKSLITRALRFLFTNNREEEDDQDYN